MSHTEITMYGTAWCSDCKRTKKFFGEQRVHYDYVDIDGNDEGQAIVERLNDGKQSIPTLLFGDGSVLIEPSNAELAAKLGLQTSAKNQPNIIGPTIAAIPVFSQNKGRCQKARAILFPRRTH